MKLLMLGWELPPYNSGGLGVACYQMAKALARIGVDIQFVLPYKAKHLSASKFMEIVPACDVPPMVNEKGEYISMGAYSGTCAWCNSRECEHAREYGAGFVDATHKYALHVERLAKRKKLKPDVIHAHDWLTMEAGARVKRVTGRPLIVHVHATEFDRAGGSYGNPLIHEIEYQGLVVADRIMAVSQITKDIIVREYHIPADKIEVVHNSLDPDELERTTVETDNYIYAKELQKQGWTTIVSIGRLTISKGLTYLLEAASLALSRNPKMLFLVSGAGEQRDQLIELAADLGISDRVIFTGWVRGQRRTELYEIADMFIMTSISETFGLTALVAAHYNTAVLISKQSGASEILRNVMKFDYWDTRRMADEIINISLSQSLKQELKEGVTREYLNLSWEDIAEKLICEYHRVMSDRNREVNKHKAIKEGAIL